MTPPFHSSRPRLGLGLLSGLLSAALPLSAQTEERPPLLPLPGEAFASPDTSDPFGDPALRSVGDTGSIVPTQLPDKAQILSENGTVEYRADGKSIIYSNPRSGVRMVTEDGLDMQSRSIRMDLGEKVSRLEGPVTIYQGEMLILADSATYDWQKQSVQAQGVKAKMQGLIVRSDRADFTTLPDKRQRVSFLDTFVSTDDSESPDAWLGAKELSVVAGETITVGGLSFAAEDYQMRVPILGWFTFTHSLNPREGYLPIIGSKSIWGAYWLNQYGFLIGNRRVENGIPTADYLVTTRLDGRTRRGLGYGLDAEETAMAKLYPEMTGLSLYFADDIHPNINPTNIPREPIDRFRYRLALQTYHKLVDEGREGTLSLATNINVLSDRYMLRDFFEDLSRVDDKPDNTVRLEWVQPTGQLMFNTRFAPNDYYPTETRAELSAYRVRSVIGNTGIAYETNNAMGYLRQEVPAFQRAAYREALSRITDSDVRNYYERLLNEQGFFRINSTHELSTSFKILNFLNVTPKLGGAYSGYFHVDRVGTDNRFLGYGGCDFDIKFHRTFESFSLPSLRMRTLTHLIHPYATFSSGTLSSSNPLVPQLDSWSSTLSGSTNNPIPLDLCSFTGIDSWDNWTIWRMGVHNRFTTLVDGESRALLDWNAFIDYNVSNPNTTNEFSNLYSLIRFTPTERLTLRLETQFPVIGSSDGFNQYNMDLSYMPYRWLETSIGLRYMSGHPILEDSKQTYIQANLRINDRYTVAGRWNWDIEQNRMPIQQYSIFRHSGPWHIGATLFFRDNGGKRETGFGISFTLSETGTALPINFL